MSKTEISAKHTPGPWGVEQSREMLWVGPMREDGRKVETVVVGLNIDSELTASAALRQHRNALLIAAAPELLVALEDFDNWFCGFNPDDQASRMEGRGVVIRARAAIARATGQSVK